MKAVTLTPLPNHAYVRDIKLPQRTRGGIHLPLPSVAHGGTIQSVRPYQLGLLISKGKSTKPVTQDTPKVGAVIVYSNTAGRAAEREGLTPTFRVINQEEILCEILNYDAEELTFI